MLDRRTMKKLGETKTNSQKRLSKFRLKLETKYFCICDNTLFCDTVVVRCPENLAGNGSSGSMYYDFGSVSAFPRIFKKNEDVLNADFKMWTVKYANLALEQSVFERRLRVQLEAETFLVRIEY